MLINLKLKKRKTQLQYNLNEHLCEKTQQVVTLLRRVMGIGRKFIVAEI